MAKAAKDLPKTPTPAKAAPAPKDAKPAKAKQAFIPGTEPPSFADLDELGQEYQDKKLARMALLAEEIELADELQGLMHKYKLDYYAIPDTDLDIVLEPIGEKLKVKRRKTAKGSTSETDFGDED